MAYVLGNQIYISTQLKTEAKIIKAVFFDSGVYLLLFLFSILAYFDLINSSIYFFNKILLGYSCLYVIYAISRILKIDRLDVFINYLKVLKYSLPVLVGGILIYFLTVSGRIFVEYFVGGFEIVGIYSFYFRLAAVVVVIYQIINIVFFRQMYELEPKKLDFYFSISFIGLYIISIIAFLVSPLILPFFSEFYKTTIQENISIHFLLSAQMIFWIATALLSNIIDREKLAGKNNILFVFLLVALIGMLFLTQSYLDLELFVILHLIAITLAAMIQTITLARKKIFFKKSVAVLFLLNIFTFIILFLFY
jgi:O-antigen/teichoic acid export membrane protein